MKNSPIFFTSRDNILYLMDSWYIHYSFVNEEKHQICSPYFAGHFFHFLVTCPFFPWVESGNSQPSIPFAHLKKASLNIGWCCCILVSSLAPNFWNIAPKVYCCPYERPNKAQKQSSKYDLELLVLCMSDVWCFATETDQAHEYRSK